MQVLKHAVGQPEEQKCYNRDIQRTTTKPVTKDFHTFVILTANCIAMPT